MKAASSLTALAFACACAGSSQAQQVSSGDLAQFSLPRPTPQQSVPAAPAGKIRVLPDGRVLVGKGVVKVSVAFQTNDSLLVSFAVVGGARRGTVLTCADIKKTPDLSGEAREAFTLTLHGDLLKSPQAVARVAERIEPFSLQYIQKGDGPNILRAVINEVVTQLDEEIILAKLICGSAPTAP
jgi:hypothetical protein